LIEMSIVCMELGGDSSETTSFLSQEQPVFVTIPYLALLLHSLPEFTDAHVLDNLDSVLIMENKCLGAFYFIIIAVKEAP